MKCEGNGEMSTIKNIDEVFALLSDVEQSKFQYDIEHSKSVYGQICYKHGYENRDKEIIRCKDCKKRRKLPNWINGQAIDTYYCERFNDSEIGKVEPNDFCSYGERKEKK